MLHGLKNRVVNCPLQYTIVPYLKNKMVLTKLNQYETRIVLYFELSST